MSTSTAKRSWLEAQQDAIDLRNLCAGCYHKWEFAGSLRRKKMTVGDIEHVIIPKTGDVPGEGLFGGTVVGNLLWARLDELLKLGTVTKHVYGATGYRWGDKYRGVDFNGFNHELFMAEPYNWGAVYLIRTGPAEYSERVVTALKRGGMYRQQGGVLVHVESGEVVPVPDEQTYVRLAGMPWTKPELRA